MNSLDIAILSIALIFFIRGIFRGFIFELVTVLGLILGYIISITYLSLVAGYILSQFIGLSVFSTSIAPRYELIPLAILISVFVALFASVIPVRRAVKVEPAVVLKGE